MKSGIYCIENLLNGNCYLGSSVNIDARFKIHKYELNRNNTILINYKKIIINII